MEHHAVRYYYYEHVSGIQIADTVLEITTNQNIQAHFQAQVFYLLIDSGEQVGSDMVVSMELEIMPMARLLPPKAMIN